MSNHNQLELLTSTQAGLIDAALAAGSLKVAELVKVDWPSPDGTKVYSWWNCLADSAYTTNLNDWLDGAPLIPGFIAPKNANGSPGPERFHNIPRTAALSDDVVAMKFTNYGRVFEELCYKWRGGVKVEIFYFFPEIADDALSRDYTVVSWFVGHLRKADEANEDFVSVSVRSGVRSPHVLVPGRIQGSNCQWYYNGATDKAGNRIFPTGLPDNPCDIDAHFGGTRGTDDPSTGNLWANCNQTLNQGTNNCIAINGSEAAARAIYGGDDYVTASTLIGNGGNRTRSTTVGNELRLENLPVAYGKFNPKNLHLKRYAKEYDDNEEQQDDGTIRTVFAVSEGPVQSISEVKVMDRPLPRTDGLGLEVRLGTQRQAATTYAADMLPLNRTAHFRADVHPLDPNGVQAPDIVGECIVEGRSTVKQYIADWTYTQGYTTNRIDCLVELIENQIFGFRMDKTRMIATDIVDLRALNSQFNAYVQQRTFQQLVEDICLAAVGNDSPGWFRPFWYNGKLRILPILNTDLTLSDIKQIKSNFGATRNVLIDPQTKLPRLYPNYKNNDEIRNAYTVMINQADKGYIERPITFNADQDQFEEGLHYGDESKRRDPETVAGFGLTTEAEARVLGEFLVKNGKFATGGLMNNLGLGSVALCAVSSLALNMHENKIFKFPAASNDRLIPYKDEDDNQFEYFMVTSMTRTPRLELIANFQVWSEKFWADFCFTPGGTASGYVTWNTPDADVIDGVHGVNTQILSVSADRAGSGYCIPTSIDVASVTLHRWTHTITRLPLYGTYFVWHALAGIGFHIWENGQCHIYHNSGIDTTTLGVGAVQAGDTLEVEYDYNGGTERRYYRHNGTLVHTDTTGTINAIAAIDAVCTNTGDYIGDISFYVVHSGCASDYAVQPVGQSGGSVVIGTPGSGSTTDTDFDVLAWQIFDRPEPYLQSEVFN